MNRKASSCRRVAVLAAALTIAAASAASAQDVATFYKGKSIRLVIANGVGGGNDAYSRLLARYIVNHIPGQPSIVVENMPGAGGLRAANWLYNIAPKDGTVIGTVNNAIVVEQLFGNSAAQFDARKYEWIGAMSKQYTTCAVWHTSDIKTIDDARRRPVLVSTTGMTGNSALMPLMLNTLLGTQFKVIAGYTTTGMRMALEQGEAEGICGFSYDTFAASDPEWIRDHKIRFLLQTGVKRIKELPDVPVLMDEITDKVTREAIGVVGVREELGRPHMLPPGTPAPIVKAVRAAFDATMIDPAYVKDAERLHITIEPTSGEDVTKMLEHAYAEPPEVIALARKLWPPAVTDSKE
jgi:tripartite-type tricarboxylate transporter receptor subunit TctC